MRAEDHPVQALLNRYFEGDTSLEEEKTLHAYFQGTEVHPDHQAFAPLFQWARDEREPRLAADFEQRLIGRIQAETPVRSVRRFRALAYAAGLALALSAGWWLFRTDHMPATPEAWLTDTYDDPELAFAAFSDAMMQVAASMDLGTRLTSESVAPASQLDIFITQ